MALALILLGCGPHPCEGDAAPTDLTSLTRWVETLPQPVDAACLVHGLQRPLQVEATRSQLSAQPGTRASPRLFFFSGDLVMSLVPDGVGRDLVEFGEVVDATHSIKAELELPIELPLGEDALFERIRLDEGSHCAACHAQEREDLASVVLRPEPDTLVPLDEVHAEARRCTGGSARCALLKAVFAGPVEPHPFDERFLTFSELTAPAP